MALHCPLAFECSAKELYNLGSCTLRRYNTEKVTTLDHLIIGNNAESELNRDF
jgi:hypothetical protein